MYTTESTTKPGSLSDVPQMIPNANVTASDQYISRAPESRAHHYRVRGNQLGAMLVKSGDFGGGPLFFLHITLSCGMASRSRLSVRQSTMLRQHQTSPPVAAHGLLRTFYIKAVQLGDDTRSVKFNVGRWKIY